MATRYVQNNASVINGESPQGGPPLIVPIRVELNAVDWERSFPLPSIGGSPRRGQGCSAATARGSCCGEGGLAFCLQNISCQEPCLFIGPTCLGYKGATAIATAPATATTDAAVSTSLLCLFTHAQDVPSPSKIASSRLSQTCRRGWPGLSLTPSPTRRLLLRPRLAVDDKQTRTIPRGQRCHDAGLASRAACFALPSRERAFLQSI